MRIILGSVESEFVEIQKGVDAAEFLHRALGNAGFLGNIPFKVKFEDHEIYELKELFNESKWATR